MSESAWGGTGRPTDAESLARTSRFLCLIAEGVDVVKARKQARIDPDRALRIVVESDFSDVVKAIREGNPAAQAA